MNCNGVLDISGKLCCKYNQYIQYSISGVASCTDACIEDKQYKISFCCDSLTNLACQNSNYQSTVCSNTYAITSSCNGCPAFCS